MPPALVPDRAALLTHLATASVLGHLGLFVGTGFSKAATQGRAPGFEELLSTLARKLELTADFEDQRYRLKSLPQIASLLVEELAGLRSQPAVIAAAEFRQAAADACNFVPDSTVHAHLSEALARVVPSWIITTNYDLVLETLVDHAESVLPTQPLVTRSDRVPIYHLHGHRLEPSSVRITEEDYVALLGPIDYQRLKLPLLLLESSTVMLGYSLGDINVRSAIEWSHTFQGSASLKLNSQQGLVVQALRVSWPPRSQPYFGPNGEIIVEIADLGAFLLELGNERERFFKEEQTSADLIQDFLSTPTNALEVPTNKKTRDLFHIVLADALSYCSSSSIISFISQVLEPVWNSSRQFGAFQHYDTYVRLLIDIVCKLSLQPFRPNLMRYIAGSFNRVGPQIDTRRTSGSAFAASDRWFRDCATIPKPVARELRLLSEEAGNEGLRHMILNAPNFPQ